MADEITPPVPEVHTQAGAQVGDENVAPPREPEVEVVNEQVDAQVAGTLEPAPSKVNVHETHVELDKVITDPSSPEAVQIPDAGRGFLDLPIHALASGSPEQKFASGEAAEPVEVVAPAAPAEEPAPPAK
jgi:hypothetical protein